MIHNNFADSKKNKEKSQVGKRNNKKPEEKEEG